MTAVEEIRQAAALMRTEARFPLPEAAVLAVADWLNAAADTAEEYDTDVEAMPHPVAVARVYLGGGHP